MWRNPGNLISIKNKRRKWGEQLVEGLLNQTKPCVQSVKKMTFLWRTTQGRLCAFFRVSLKWLYFSKDSLKSGRNTTRTALPFGTFFFSFFLSRGFSSCWRRDQMQKYSSQTCSCLPHTPVVISRRKHLLCFPPSLSTLQIPPCISTIHWSFHFAVGGWRAWEGSPFVVHLNCSAKPRPYQHAAASVNGNYMCLWEYRKSAHVAHQHCSLSSPAEIVGVLMVVGWTSFSEPIPSLLFFFGRDQAFWLKMN